MSDPPVALVADVHGNLAALAAVVADAAAAGATAFWNAGDHLGYGPSPNAVAAWVGAHGETAICGDSDLEVLGRLGDDGWRPEKAAAFAWARRELASGPRDAVARLPRRRRFGWRDRRVLLVHGSPLDAREHLYPETSAARWREQAAAAAADLVVFGHSHQPLVREVDGVLFANPGSVGRAADGDPRAAYALLRERNGRPEVELRRIAYAVEATVRGVRAAGLPEAVAAMFLLGRGLKAAVVALAS